MTDTRQRPRALMIGADGAVTTHIGPRSMRDGFCGLADINAPTVFEPKLLTANEITEAGFVRAGNAISRALARASERFGR